MPRAPRYCATQGCTTLVTGKPRCPEHESQHRKREDSQRGTSVQRGYNRAHRNQRAAWARRIDQGQRVTCWRCGLPITNSRHFDLGHDDHDRTKHRGPEHRRCNRATARHRAANNAPASSPPPPR
ncbi:hypothetical protein GCM10027298_22370 [Epidermidibacterium keratini]